MGRAERRLQAKEDISLRPNFRKKIIALMKANAVDRQRRCEALADVSSQTLGRERPILQRRHVIEKPMVEFLPKRFNAKIDFALLINWGVSFLLPKRKSGAIIVAVSRSR